MKDTPIVDRAVVPVLMPVCWQSTYRSLSCKPNCLSVDCHHLLPGLWLPPNHRASPLAIVVPDYSVWWLRLMCVWRTSQKSLH